jgi:hypothetical protein
MNLAILTLVVTWLSGVLVGIRIGIGMGERSSKQKKDVNGKA